MSDGNSPTSIEAFIAELDRLTRSAGGPRRRLLIECRAHLVDASDELGPSEALRRFGSADAVAAGWLAEVSLRRATSGTIGTLLGVLAVAATTLVVIHSAFRGGVAVPMWAVVFFGAAQTTGVCLLAALSQALFLRHEAAPEPSAVRLLCRLDMAALFFAMLTLCAAAGAVPGQASPLTFAVGPGLALAATIGVWRARRTARAAARIDAPGRRGVAPRLLLVSRLVDHQWSLFAGVTALMVAASFMWARDDHGDLHASLTAVGVELCLLVGGFLVLGGWLGLRPRLVAQRS